MRTVGVGAERNLADLEKLEKQNSTLKAENKKLKKQIKELAIGDNGQAEHE